MLKLMGKEIFTIKNCVYLILWICASSFDTEVSHEVLSPSGDESFIAPTRFTGWMDRLTKRRLPVYDSPFREFKKNIDFDQLDLHCFQNRIYN